MNAAVKAVSAMALLACAGVASAQQRPGGNGPLPGDPGYGGGGGTSYQAAPPPRPSAPMETYASIAWHPDAADVWMVGDWGVFGIAKDLALKACTKAMGAGCVTADSWKNSTMVVIRDGNDNFRLAWLGSGQAELQSVLAKCAAEQLLPCETYMTFPSSRSAYSPDRKARKTYLASAWGKGDDKLYVASGLPTLAEAEQQALSACRAANPTRPCSVPASGSGFLEAGTFDKGTPFIVKENCAARAQAAGRIYCQMQNSASDCLLQSTFSSQPRRQFVHDFKTGRES